MKPEQTFRLALNFASGVSPLWLWLLLPSVLLLSYWLYRREIGAMGKRQRRTLYALRLILVGAVCFGLFMPELGIVRSLLYRGRIVFLVDNSESMLANDSSMPVLDALQVARALREEPLDEKAQTPTEDFFRLSLHYREVVDRLRDYQRDIAQIGRNDPDMARLTQRLQDRATVIFIAVDSQTERVPLDRLPQELREQIGDSWMDTASARREWDDLFSVGIPSSQDVDRVCDRFEEALVACGVFQREIDRQDIETDGAPLKKMATSIISGKRLGLARDTINRRLSAIRQWTPGQFIQVTDLMGGETRTLKKGDNIPERETRRGRTDIVASLEHIVEESNDFPLSAVVLVSDGVDWSTRNPDAMLKSCVRKRIPLFCAGVGHTEEPFDMAIERLSVPPLAVQGQPVTVGVHVKAAVSLPTSCTLAILSGGQELSAETVDLHHPHQIVYLPVTPNAIGFQHYVVELRTMGADLFKEQNNRSEFVLEVREQPVRVLLLDDRPRWQTRFALNILSRLPYVDLNRIIRVTSPDGIVKRGLDRGTWPDSAAALNIYDLILLGRFDTPMLDEKEWDQVVSFVTEEGKALALLAPGDTDQLPEKLKRWLPVAESGVTPPDASSLDLSALCITPEGLLHPLTRGLGDALTEQALPGSEMTPEGFALLHGPAGRGPVVSCRYAGKGRVFLLDDDRLWQALNSHHLGAHGSMFVHLADWSVRNFRDDVAVDQNVLLEGDAFQVWSRKPDTQVMLLDPRGREVARAKAIPSPSSMNLYRAMFAPPAPGVYKLQLGSNGRVDPLFVLPDNTELTRLAMAPDALRGLASRSGGAYRPLSDVDRFFAGLPLKERREVHRYVLKLWSSRGVLLGLLLLLGIEWILRKYWRLV